jgi:hypothetical protein
MHRSPKTKRKNHIVTLREEEVLTGDRVLVEVIFLEEEEKAEDETLGAMPMERQDTSLGISPREREEAKLTFRKHRSEMLR